jgi:hypothetical protein
MRIISFLAALLLLASCRRNPPNMDFNKNAELPGNVVAEYYNKAAMDSLVAKINSIPEMAEDLKTARLDTLTGESLSVNEIKRLAGKEHIPFEKGFSSNFFLIVASNKNAVLDWDKQENKYGFTLKKNDITDTRIFQDMHLWNYHIGNYAPNVRFDSIQKDEVKKLKVVVEAEQIFFKKVKYLVTVCDMVFKRPKMLENDTFEGGLLITEIKVYDGITGAKMGQTITLTTSKENVPDTSGGLNVKKVKETVLLEDLFTARNKKVMNFLQNKTSDEKEHNNK